MRVIRVRGFSNCGRLTRKLVRLDSASWSMDYRTRNNVILFRDAPNAVFFARFVKRKFTHPSLNFQSGRTPGGGGGVVRPEKLGRGVRPASQNPYSIYDQNQRFSLPCHRANWFSGETTDYRFLTFLFSPLFRLTRSSCGPQWTILWWPNR